MTEFWANSSETIVRVLTSHSSSSDVPIFPATLVQNSQTVIESEILTLLTVCRAKVPSGSYDTEVTAGEAFDYETELTLKRIGGFTTRKLMS